MPAMPSIADVANSTEQATTRLWTKARQILDTCPRSALRYKTNGDNHYILSPGVSVTLDPDAADDSYTYAVAAQADKRDKTAPIDSQLFLVVDDNVTAPAFAFEKYFFDAPLLRATDLNPVNITGAEEILKCIKGEIDSKIRWNKRNRDDRRETIARWSKGTGITVAVLMVLAGIPFGIYSYIHHQHVMEDQRYADFVEAYDARGIVLNGTSISPGESKFPVNDPATTSERVPSLDSLSSRVRSVSIDAGNCKSVGQISQSAKLIAASNGPKENVTVLVDTEGKVAVCAIPNAYAKEKDSNGKDITPSYDVLLQVRAN